MSAALKKELTSATSCNQKRNEEEQAFLGRLVSAIANLDDADWDALSPDAQDWYNDAAEAANKSKAIVGFGDEEEAPAKPARGSRAAKKEEPAEEEPAEEDDIKVGDQVVAVTKRGKEISGKVVEIDGETLILELEDGEEEEVDTTKLKQLSVQKPEPKKTRGTRADKKEEPAEEEDDEIEVGQKVTATSKRGKEVTGEVIEIDDEVVVISDEDGEEHELDRDKLASLVVVKAPAKPARGSRGAAKEEAPAKTRAPKVSKEDNGGVSVTTRIRELILDDLDAEVSDIEKSLKKEKLAYKEATLKLIYGEVHRLLDMLKERKLLKTPR